MVQPGFHEGRFITIESTINSMLTFSGSFRPPLNVSALLTTASGHTQMPASLASNLEDEYAMACVDYGQDP